LLFDFSGEPQAVLVKSVVQLAFRFVRGEIPDQGGFRRVLP
jgi:hypothetical protein